jgi:DNA-directed RNA polymerase specialized sigma24 family protein
VKGIQERTPGRGIGRSSPADEDRAQAPENDLEALYRRHAADLLGLAHLLTGDPDAARELAEEAFLHSVGRFQHRRAERHFSESLRRNLVTVFLAREHRDASPEPPDDPLWVALASLPARPRAAVVLRHCAGLSELEVARAMRCSAPTVRTLVGQGMEGLEALLESPA